MQNNHPNFTSHRQRRRGFTLTEIAIVLGIVGLILGAIWVAAAAVYNNLRISHGNTEVLQIAQGVRALYSTAHSTTGLTTDNVVCSKAVPSDMINAAGCTGAGTLFDPWPSGVTTVLPTGGTGSGFYIEMTNVPTAACIDLIMAVAGPSRDPGLFYAGSFATPVGGIGSAAAPTTDAAPPITASPTVGAAQTACGAGPLTTVAFGFNLQT